jgi:hypothetical protein
MLWLSQEEEERIQEIQLLIQVGIDVNVKSKSKIQPPSKTFSLNE